MIIESAYNIINLLKNNYLRVFKTKKIKIICIYKFFKNNLLISQNKKYAHQSEQLVYTTSIF